MKKLLIFISLSFLCHSFILLSIQKQNVKFENQRSHSYEVDLVYQETNKGTVNNKRNIQAIANKREIYNSNGTPRKQKITNVENASREIVSWEIFRPSPAYPKKAKRREQEGEVIVKIISDKRGFIKIAELFKGSGFYLLDNSAIEIIKKWRVLPSNKELVSFNFKLK